MKVLIVENDADLARVWRRHLERMGAIVSHAVSQDDAIDVLQSEEIDVIVLDIVLTDGSAFAVADFASYRSPETRIVVVSKSTFFSDGSIFGLLPNTAAFLQAGTAPDDLAAIVEHHGNNH